MFRIILISCFALLTLQPSYLFALSSQGTVQKVTDGDTFRARIDGKSFSVRLICIDAPEKEENPKLVRDAERTGANASLLIAAGRRSTLFLKDILKEGDSVTFEYGPEKFDHYGRVLAYVYLANGTFLNSTLVREGYAGVNCVYPNGIYEDQLYQEALEAKRKRKGLWSDGVPLPLRYSRKRK